MDKIEKLKQYMRKEMAKIIEPQDLSDKSLKDKTFFFCWGQAKFDTLMDIDRELNLGVFYKKEEEK